MGGLPAAAVRVLACAIGLALVCALAVCLDLRAACADAGDLDLSFGGNGVATPTITGADSAPVRAVATQSDGKIICLAEYNISASGARDFVLFRLLPDGTLDTSFGSGGWVITDFGACDCPEDVAVQLDDRIVAVGVMEPGCGADSNYRGIIARYLPDGALDNSFGTNGKHIMSETWETGWNAVAVDWADRAVVAGFWGSDICVGRFTIGGAPDSSYGTSGMAFLAPTASDSSWAEDVAIDGSGRAVVAGTVKYSAINPDMVAARFTTDGDLDTTFASDGYWNYDLAGNSADYATGLAIDSAGRVYLGGRASGGSYGADYTAVAVRLTAVGGTDVTFNGNGKSTLPVTGEDMYTGGIALDPWEQPVLAGYFGSSSGPFTDDSWIVRFHLDGVPDFFFGGDGLEVVRYGSYCNIYNGVFPVPGGRVLCAGSTGGYPIITRHRMFALDLGACLGMLLAQ